MMRWLALTGIVAAAVVAIMLSERRKVDVAADPAPLLYLIGDTEQELTRLPVRFTRMSDQAEIAIGDQLASHYDSSWKDKKDEDRDVQAYVEQVGGRLASGAHRQLPYRFHYIPDQYSTNAFALPGGHVFIGKGLIALMDSEDELAAVLGHEIEHIEHYHCAERIQRQQALRKVPFGELIALPIEVFEAGYSKDQELEADREGTRLAEQAGYSANGAIRMFETFQRLYEEYHTRARTPQQELSTVAQQTLEEYFRSHPLASERIAQIQTIIATEHWPTRAERDLAVGYVFQTDRAEAALQAGKFAIAAQMATNSLKVRTAQPRAMLVLAKAQFAQADFSAAAISFHRLLELSGPQPEIANQYAYALAAADPHRAASEFRQWMGSVAGNTNRFTVTLAGLELLAGDPGPARIAAASAEQDPPLLGELGWWYYRAGDFGSAADLITRAYQKRPGDTTTIVRLAWSQIELHRLADALQTLEAVQYELERVPAAQGMARAVCKWQARQPDEALQDFERALSAGPEWQNPRWVTALYSPLVVQSVQEMRGEQERRRKLQASAR